MVSFGRILLIIAIFKASCASIDEVDQYIAENKGSVNPRFRLQYHIAAEIGWINDPNGFSYYNGQYHMFYQFYPFSSIAGVRYWGHLVSDNLVDWSHLPAALEPADFYDKDGVFSGSGIVSGDQLVLIYTGYVATHNGSIQTQNLAYSNDGITFTKYEGNPIIANPPDGNWEFRDPKVWQHEDYYYAVIGSQTPDGRGRVVTYRSSDLFEWSLLGVVGESSGDLGYMWECPDMFELNGRYVLLMSPQGVESQGERFRNLFQTAYFVGDFDYSTGQLVNIDYSVENMRELDFGHDIYATQTMLTPDGRRVVVGWMGMWASGFESTTIFEETEDGWAGALTLLRELTLGDDGVLRMVPVEEVTLLRTGLVNSTQLSPGEGFYPEMSAFELEVWAETTGEVSLEFHAGELLYSIHYLEGKMRVYKGDDERVAEWVPGSDLYWRIFVDTSSVELFCGGGEVVFTSRFYPQQELYVRAGGDSRVRLLQHALRPSIGV